MGLFGSSGIRGIVNQEITPEFAVNIGCAVGSFHKRIVVGYDTRTSNVMLSNAVLSGILSTGAEAYLAGLVTTPTLAYAARKFDCGIMLTASHNPAQYNGIKLWNSSGISFSQKQEKAIETVMETGEYKRSKWDRIQNSNIYHNAVREHQDFIKKKIGKLDLKVVIDCANGPASNITPYLFRELGCNVFAINSHPDGYFPGRNPEPVEENLYALKASVIHHRADLGIAHDGDADRMVAVDDRGTYIGGDKLLLLFAKYITRKKMVVPVDASMALDEYGKQVIRTRVGDVFIAQEIFNCRADFGGEPSGTWIFPEISLCPDGVYAAARLAKLIKEKGKLSILTQDLKGYYILRGKIDYDKKKKDRIEPAIEKALLNIDTMNITRTDGIRLSFKSSWVVVRFSGTEPKIRITVEAKKEKEAKILYAKIHKILTRCI